MRIMFLTLPEAYRSGRTVVLPLGLCYIISNLPKGTEVALYDQALCGTFEETGGVMIYGDSKANIQAQIENFNPEVIALSCNYSYQHMFLVDMIKVIRRFYKGKIIAGGNHITAFNLKYKLLDGLDAVIMGEGEVGVPAYLEGRHENKVYHVEDLETLKPPWRGMLENYFRINLPHDQTGRRVASMITSRGCSYNCLYCSVKTIWGRKFRPRKPEGVIAEARELVEKYKAEEIHFEDDNLLFDKQRFLKICQGLKELKVKWTCPNGMDMSKIDDELMEAMVDSGCYRVTICPESYNNRILKFYRKHFTEKMIDEKVALIGKYPVELVGFFIVYAPMETKEEILRTLDYAYENFDSYDVSILAPYLGTDLWDYCEERDIFGSEFVKSSFFVGADYTSNIKNEHLSNVELLEIMQEKVQRRRKKSGLFKEERSRG